MTDRGPIKPTPDAARASTTATATGTTEGLIFDPNRDITAKDWDTIIHGVDSVSPSSEKSWPNDTRLLIRSLADLIFIAQPSPPRLEQVRVLSTKFHERVMHHLDLSVAQFDAEDHYGLVDFLAQKAEARLFLPDGAITTDQDIERIKFLAGSHNLLKGRDYFRLAQAARILCLDDPPLRFDEQQEAEMRVSQDHPLNTLTTIIAARAEERFGLDTAVLQTVPIPWDQIRKKFRESMSTPEGWREALSLARNATILAANRAAPTT